jgi:hypothetical protein
MQIADAQREVRTVFAGGFWGQLVSAVIWLASAALATWSTPKASIVAVVAGGFFIFPLTKLLITISGGRTSLSPENSLNQLGMQVAFSLPFTMLLLIPVATLRLNWFFPALMVLVGAHYLPFAFLYGMRMFMALGALLIFSGTAIAHFSAASFALGAWVGGATLFAFACIGRMTVQSETRA